MTADSSQLSQVFIELGAAVLGLSLVARIASRLGFSAIPLYLLAGLAFGNGGLAPLPFSEHFIHTGGEIGVLLLLFMMGIEHSGAELRHHLRVGYVGGLADFILNFPPGFLAGLWMGWSPLAAVFLGGVTYDSSSGVVAKLMNELGWKKNPETPVVISILVFEDLAMAAYLPLLAVLIVGGGPGKIATSVSIALLTAFLVLVLALRFGEQLSRIIGHPSDEVLLLTSFGAVLLVAGIAQRFQVSAAIGAFLLGIALSGPIAERAGQLLSPLRDLFAATFFFFFGLQIDPKALPGVFFAAAVLGVVTGATKLLTGHLATKRVSSSKGAGLRAGIALLARGEFSMVIAGLGVAVEPRLGPFAAAYVLLLVILGPLLARAVK
ncbi:MAG TPA: cation:proton antiporter [Terriglobales bacterium]|jgi:monovalent cation:H+ antiporter-2, CPA2 family|nr:cation:proton antiporter [Terriglobales bacterium]